MLALLRRVNTLDRRWIFAIVLASAIVPMFVPMSLPLAPGRVVTALHQAVERVPEGGTVVFSFDFGPSTATEMQPAALACLRHLEKRHAHIVGMAIWNEGANESRKVLTKWVQGAQQRGYPQTYGTTWVNLGYKAGGALSLRQMGTDLHGTFPEDIDHTPIAQVPIMQGLRKLGDADLILTFSSADPGIKQHIQVEATQLGLKVGGAVTAVTAPEMAPYLNAGQLVGLMGGLRGAAEYEVLLQAPGDAVRGMNIQSSVHIVLVLLIALSNIAWLATRSNREGPRA